MLSAYEWLPFKLDDENNITVANGQVFMMLAANRLSFFETLLIEPPILLICYYFGLISEAKYMIDPENGERFDADQQNQYINDRMIITAVLVALFVVNHYFN
jgi:hypothetical protein